MIWQNLLPQFLASLPRGLRLKNFTLDEIPTFIHSHILDEDFQTKSFIKMTCKGDDANMGTGGEGVWNS